MKKMTLTEKHNVRFFDYEQVQEALEPCASYEGAEHWDISAENGNLLKMYIYGSTLFGCIMRDRNTQISDDFQIDVCSDFWELYQRDLLEEDLFVCENCGEIFNAPTAPNKDGFYCMECHTSFSER